MAYSQLQKIEANVQIMVSAEQFYDVYCNRTHQIPNICPEIIKSIKLQEGEWGSEGCIQTWSYVHGGKSCVANAVVESIDKENKKMTFKIMDGELMEHYKSLKIEFQVTPKEKGAVVHLAMEYEKQNDQVPEPTAFLHHTVVPVAKKVGAQPY